MTDANLKYQNSSNDYDPLFPKAVLSVSREEYYKNPLGLCIQVRKDLALEEHNIHPSSSEFLEQKYWHRHDALDLSQQGPLPNDLQGHVFIIGTAGSFDSEYQSHNPEVRVPNDSGWQHLYYGDGIIYRLDFHLSSITKDIENQEDNETQLKIIQHPGWAKFSSRIIKTLDYFVDKQLEDKNNNYEKKWSKSDFQKSIFRDAAIARISLALGVRNFLNTAWLRMKSSQNNSERLLVTWDAGRPYEVDPLTLDLIAPVGFNSDWKPAIQATNKNKLSLLRRFCKSFRIFPQQLFPLIVSTAHPVYDPNENIVFGLNATKSLKTTLQISRLSNFFKERILRPIEDEITKIASFNSIYINVIRCFYFLVKIILSAFLSFLLLVVDTIVTTLSHLGIGGKDHLFVYQWNGSETQIKTEDKWEIVNSHGKSIQLKQSPHQMALTREYIIISDSSFKGALSDIIPSIIEPQYFSELLNRFINVFIEVQNLSFRFASLFSQGNIIPLRKRERLGENFNDYIQEILSYLNYPQYNYTDIYVIPRPDKLHLSDYNSSLRKIEAQQFKLEPETAHFFANYDNADKKITIHVGHISALDPAEFYHKIDFAVCGYSMSRKETQTCSSKIIEEQQERAGILLNGLADNKLGVWTLDLDKKTCEKNIITDPRLRRLAFFTFNENNTSIVEDIYWSCEGAWPYNLSDYYINLYKERIEAENIDIENEITKVSRFGSRANLIRVNQIVKSGNDESHQNELSIKDCYCFPKGFTLTSPQFVPRNGKSAKSTDGYITCIVTASDNFLTSNDINKKFCEIWIFDACNLEKGPIYRLSHPMMNIGPSLHTAWLSKIESPSAREDYYELEKDYEELLSKIEPIEYKERVRELFLMAIELYKKEK